MDIVKITLIGYGCEIARGTISNKNYNKVEKIINDVWHKDLFKKIKKETEIKTYSEDYGIIKGDIIIELNGKQIFEQQLTTLEILNINLLQYLSNILIFFIFFNIVTSFILILLDNILDLILLISLSS